MTKRLSALLLAALFLAAAPPAHAQRVMTVASLLGEDKPETRVWVRFRELVNARLPGRFDIRIVPNAALGAEREVAEGVRLGSVQGTLLTLAALSSWVPEAQLMDLPFLFRDRADVARVLAAPVGAELRARIDAAGFHVLGPVIYGARHLLAKAPVARPAELAGKRIRVIQSPLHTELWRALGANPTPIPITETYNALKTGVVDMMDLTVSAYAGFKLYEVVPVVIETGHIWSVGVLTLGQRFWASLSPEEQAVFTAAGAEASAYFDELMVADEAASAKEARARGARFVAPADRAAWEAAARPVWEAFAPKLGGMDKVQAVLNAR